MMKKTYDTPQVKVVELNPASLICTSPPLTKMPVSQEEMEENEDFE